MSKRQDFYYSQEGKLYCEGIDLEKFVSTLPPKKCREVSLLNGTVVSVDVPPTPAFIYSSSALKKNVKSYLEAIQNEKLNCRLGYAVKANGNHLLLTSIKSFGVEMLVCVSGNEVLAGIDAGFSPGDIILNGNGKQEWEIKLAMELGTLLNVDSVFDAQRICGVHLKYFPSKEVKLLLRVRPQASVHQEGKELHPYVNTAETSKFGFGLEELDQILDILSRSEALKVHGIHCHLGSCIYDSGVYQSMGGIMQQMISELEKRGHALEILDIGGGIGINYNESVTGSGVAGDDMSPSVPEFISVIAKMMPKNMTIVLEPGRSLAANTGIVLCSVLGVKSANSKKYVVVDASMAEVIRPCLYNAHHQIVPTCLTNGEKMDKYDVVGPICESADFIGRDILLPTNNMANYLAIMDTGAYCSSMSSNYNMRPRPMEIMIDGTSWKVIRERDNYKDVTNAHDI